MIGNGGRQFFDYGDILRPGGRGYGRDDPGGPDRPLTPEAVVDGRLLVTFTALFDDEGFAVGRGKSFLRALGLEWGFAANFGKRSAQFAGLRNRP